MVVRRNLFRVNERKHIRIYCDELNLNGEKRVYMTWHINDIFTVHAEHRLMNVMKHFRGVSDLNSFIWGRPNCCRQLGKWLIGKCLSVYMTSIKKSNLLWNNSKYGKRTICFGEQNISLSLPMERFLLLLDRLSHMNRKSSIALPYAYISDIFPTTKFNCLSYLYVYISVG